VSDYLNEWRSISESAQLEEMNRQQLALNGLHGNGLWQDMTPYIDDLVEMMTPTYPPADTFDPLANIKASEAYGTKREASEQ